MKTYKCWKKPTHYDFRKWNRSYLYPEILAALAPGYCLAKLAVCFLNIVSAARSHTIDSSAAMFSHTTAGYPARNTDDVMSFHKFQHRGSKNVIIQKHEDRKVLWHITTFELQGFSELLLLCNNIEFNLNVVCRLTYKKFYICRFIFKNDLLWVFLVLHKSSNKLWFHKQTASPQIRNV